MEAQDQAALEACLWEQTATIDRVDTKGGMFSKIKEWEMATAKTFKTWPMNRFRMPMLLEQQDKASQQDLKVKMR